MKETLLVQDPAVEMGGGVALKQLTIQDRADAAYERVAKVFRSGVKPTQRAYVTRGPDGSSCACAIGALAIAYDARILNFWPKMYESLAQYDTMAAICNATDQLSKLEVLALERGFMHPDTWGQVAALRPFHEAGKRIYREFFDKENLPL